MQTMLLYNGLLYNLGWNGRLMCMDAISGEMIYQEKLGKSESFTASPVASDGKIYCAGDDGKVYTVIAGRDFRVEKTNELQDVCMVTPSITENVIFFRTAKSLIAISKVN